MQKQFPIIAAACFRFRATLLLMQANKLQAVEIAAGLSNLRPLLKNISLVQNASMEIDCRCKRHMLKYIYDL